MVGPPRVTIMGPMLRSVCALAVCIVLGSSVSAQEPETRCAFLCAPELKLEPTFTFEPIFRNPEVEDLTDGSVAIGNIDAVFELILSLGIPTEIPRVGFTIETIFIPSGEVDEKPSSFRGNEIEFELELNLSLLEPEQTGGWIDSHFDIVDKLSGAERPSDNSSYTHKLNFEWDTAFLVFQWLPESNWLRNVEIETSLDYVASGLPKAGDIVGRERFLSDDSPWSFSLVFVFPLAPLVP